LRTAICGLLLAAGVAAAAASAAGGPGGYYYAKITGAKPAALNATWALGIRSPAFAITRNNTAVVAGRVTISGGKIAFRDLKGSLACKGAQAVGTYGWKLVGKTLKLTPYNDPCVGRKAILTHPFTKIG